VPQLLPTRRCRSDNFCRLAVRSGAGVEAQQRLARLGRTFALRIAAAGPEEWDRPRTPNCTLREICDHLTRVVWYAEQVGRLPR
jgi:hypothetical protein